MADFSAFMAQNVQTLENKRVVISKRFKDADGKPIEWEIRAISSEENEELQRKCYVSTPVVGQRGAFTRELDQIKYTNALLAMSVVYPDLNNASLQDSYGVKTPEQLLKKMLYPREEAVLANEVMAFSQIEELDELVEEAKN